MRDTEWCQAAANQLCSRHIEIIHCGALKAVEAWVQHKKRFPVSSFCIRVLFLLVSLDAAVEGHCQMLSAELNIMSLTKGKHVLHNTWEKVMGILTQGTVWQLQDKHLRIGLINLFSILTCMPFYFRLNLFFYLVFTHVSPLFAEACWGTHWVFSCRFEGPRGQLIHRVFLEKSGKEANYTALFSSMHFEKTLCGFPVLFSCSM